MTITAEQLARMSRKEKLDLMEVLWTDLSRTDTELESPEWHRRVLDETRARVAEGQEQAMDWDIAKEKLRERFQ